MLRGPVEWRPDGGSQDWWRVSIVTLEDAQTRSESREPRCHEAAEGQEIPRRDPPILQTLSLEGERKTHHYDVPDPEEVGTLWVKEDERRDGLWAFREGLFESGPQEWCLQRLAVGRTSPHICEKLLKFGIPPRWKLKRAPGGEPFTFIDRVAHELRGMKDIFEEATGLDQPTKNGPMCLTSAARILATMMNAHQKGEPRGREGG